MCKHIWLSWYHLHSSLLFGSDLSVYGQRCGCRSTCPITGATDKVYFRVTPGRDKSGPYRGRRKRGPYVSSISSCSIRVFFAGRLLWTFHQLPTLWMQRNLLLVPSTLLCYLVVSLY
jgi:hypothetical protein